MQLAAILVKGHRDKKRHSQKWLGASKAHSGNGPLKNCISEPEKNYPFINNVE